MATNGNQKNDLYDETRKGKNEEKKNSHVDDGKSGKWIYYLNFSNNVIAIYYLVLQFAFAMNIRMFSFRVLFEVFTVNNGTCQKRWGLMMTNESQFILNSN